MPSFLSHFPLSTSFFLRGQVWFILQACGNLLGIISSSSSRKEVWTDGSGPNLLPVNGWQLPCFLWCFREGRALPDSTFSLADCTCQEQHMVLGACREPWTGGGCRSPTATPALSGPAGWHQLKHHTAKWSAPKRASHRQPKRQWSHQGIKTLRLCSVLLNTTLPKPFGSQAVLLMETWHLRMMYFLCLQMRRGKPW